MRVRLRQHESTPTARMPPDVRAWIPFSCSKARWMIIGNYVGRKEISVRYEGFAVVVFFVVK